MLVSESSSSAPKAKKSKAAAAESDEEEEGEFATVGKGGKAIQYTPDGIFKNLQLVQEARGKKVRSLAPTCGAAF